MKKFATWGYKLGENGKTLMPTKFSKVLPDEVIRKANDHFKGLEVTH